jgi:cysteine-rich repeat protein
MLRTRLCLASVCVSLLACAQGTTTTQGGGGGAPGGSGGSGGEGGAGASAGSGGVAGMGGAAGAAGMGGSAGEGGTAGSGGAAGMGGSAGAAGSGGASGTCGNGLVEAGEACDDGNTSACGTCNPVCGASQPGNDCPEGLGCASDADCVCTCAAGACVGPPKHTISIDGTNDFAPSETFATTTAGSTAYFAWDATYLYVGMEAFEVASGSSTRWVVLYLGGAGGTTTGVQYNTQAPTLPFAAKWHVRWKASNDFTNALTWTGNAWADAAWDFTGDVFQSGDFVELRIPRADVGSPSTLDVHVGMLDEQAGSEKTYASAPSTSHVDSYDPNYTKRFSIDFASCAGPSSLTPL